MYESDSKLLASTDGNIFKTIYEEDDVYIYTQLFMTNLSKFNPTRKSPKKYFQDKNHVHS